VAWKKLFTDELQLLHHTAALNEGNPGLNVGDDTVESIEGVFRRLREALLGAHYHCLFMSGRDCCLTRTKLPQPANATSA
jgi:hypothetical protein